MARPLEITEELLVKARKFIEERSNVSVHSLLPTIEGLALELGIHRDTVYAWEEAGEKSPEEENYSELLAEFSDIVKELRSAQAEKLIQNGLQTRYNPMMAKLMLSKHGYVEKSEQDITSKGDKIAAPPDPALAAEFADFLAQKTKS